MSRMILAVAFLSHWLLQMMNATMVPQRRLKAM